jgi:hypothetical protein
MQLESTPLQQRTTHLVIVSRENGAMFDRLRSRFAIYSPGVEVIFDRRKTPRGPQTPERRARGESTETRLWTDGFVVVVPPWSDGRSEAQELPHTARPSP